MCEESKDILFETHPRFTFYGCRGLRLVQAIVTSRDVNNVVGIDCAKLCLRALSSSIILPQERLLLDVCQYILQIQSSVQ